MELNLTQRQILASLYRNQYIGNWYKHPIYVFLKVYLVDEESWLEIRYKFNHAFEVIDWVVTDLGSHSFLIKDEDEERFSRAHEAIKEIVADAFKYYEQN